MLQHKYSKYFLGLCLFLTSALSLQGQTTDFLDNNGPDVVLNRILTPEVIKARKFSRIIVNEVVKRDGKRLQETGRKREYYFAKNGTLNWIYEVPFEGSTDSSLTFFYQNQDSTFLIKRKTAKGKFLSTYIKLDSLQRAVQIVKCSETSENESFRDFKPANQLVLSKEQIKYTYNGEGQLRKRYLNDDGTIYKEGILYSTLHRPNKEEISFVATGTRVIHTYEYDGIGNITSYKYYTDANGDYSETTLFSYENQRLSGQKLLKNTLPVEERFFFYNAVSGLPESMLVRKTSQYDLVFYNFTYEFH